jgi:glutaconate CoA-transferase subunit A
MDKQIHLEEAVQLLPPSRCVLAFGGITLYRRPSAFSFALINHFWRTGSPGQITVLSFTAGLESDALIGAGMVSAIRTCYCGFESFGFAPYFTKKASSGELETIEESEASIAYGLRAAMSGVGFMPSVAWQGTDMLKLRPDVQTVKDPYSDEVLTAFPAISCDVAVIHALEADQSGNARIGDHQGIDRELALVAEKVIITAETVCERLDQADIISATVDAVVEVPSGAWPSSCYPLYPVDGEAILEYLDCTGAGSFKSLMQSWYQKFCREKV